MGRTDRSPRGSAAADPPGSQARRRANAADCRLAGADARGAECQCCLSHRHKKLNYFQNYFPRTISRDEYLQQAYAVVSVCQP